MCARSQASCWWYVVFYNYKIAIFTSIAFVEAYEMSFYADYFEELQSERVYASVRLQGGPKKWGHRLMTIILSNLNQLKNFSLIHLLVNL